MSNNSEKKEKKKKQLSHHHHPPPKNKYPENIRKRKILSEETYTDKLSNIISRDYFPDLFAFHSTTRNIPKEREEGVDEFHKRYTSKDNESFERLKQKEKQLQISQKKHDDEESKAKQQQSMKAILAYEEEDLLASDLFDPTPPTKKKALMVDKTKKNTLYFIPCGEVRSEHTMSNNNIKEEIILDEYQLMPPPPNITTSRSVNDNEKRIQASQTRFPSRFSPLSSATSSVKTAVINYPHHPIHNTSSTLTSFDDDDGDTASTATDLESLYTFDLNRERQAYAAQKQKELNSFVTLTPIGDDESNISFLKHNKKTKKLKKKKQKYPTKKEKKSSNNSNAEIGNLTPAAQSLFSRLTSSSSQNFRNTSTISTTLSSQKVNARDRDTFGSVLRESYNNSSIPKHRNDSTTETPRY